MAIISLNTSSNCLKKTTTLEIIVPDIVRMDKPMSDRKTLYLLHGLSDDGSMWLRRTLIETFAEKYGIVVVMPTADRSFYLDDSDGEDYYSYISAELPQYLHKLFNLSMKKEDNFIAGLSMGAYGAMRIALLNSDKYFAVGSFSAPFDVVAILKDSGMKAFGELPSLQSNVNKHLGDMLPIELVKKAKNSNVAMYVACGLQDGLLGMTKAFEKAATENGVKATFAYSDGAHEWTFWNKAIENFLSFALE